jgi:hypothetical protein
VIENPVQAPSTKYRGPHTLSYHLLTFAEWQFICRADDEMVRAVRSRCVVIPIDVLGDQNRSGHSDVLRKRVGSLELQTLGKPFVERGLERIVFIGAPRQQGRNAGRVIGDKGQRLAGGAAAELAVIQVYRSLEFHRVRSDITQ